MEKIRFDKTLKPVFATHVTVNPIARKITIDLIDVAYSPNEKEPYTDPVFLDKKRGQYRLLAYLPHTKARDVRVTKENGCIGLYTGNYSTKIKSPVEFFEVEPRDVSDGIIEIILR